MTKNPPIKNWHPAAMVMAAGLGTRMRPLTETRPKPMVELNGKPLIDYALARLAAHNISPVVVNVHYLPDILEQHLEQAEYIDVKIADERAQLLDTGGGAYANLDLLGPDPFFVLNSDSLWIEEGQDNLKVMMDSWCSDKMDCLMLLAPTKNSLGYAGRGDFHINQIGELSRCGRGDIAAFAYTGCCLIHPRLFASAPHGPFSLNLLWDEALTHNRLFGVALNGLWLHIGTPEALASAEDRMKTSMLP